MHRSKKASRRGSYFASQPDPSYAPPPMMHNTQRSQAQFPIARSQMVAQPKPTVHVPVVAMIVHSDAVHWEQAGYNVVYDLPEWIPMMLEGAGYARRWWPNHFGGPETFRGSTHAQAYHEVQIDTTRLGNSPCAPSSPASSGLNPVASAWEPKGAATPVVSPASLEDVRDDPPATQWRSTRPHRRTSSMPAFDTTEPMFDWLEHDLEESVSNVTVEDGEHPVFTDEDLVGSDTDAADIPRTVTQSIAASLSDTHTDDAMSASGSLMAFSGQPDQASAGLLALIQDAAAREGKRDSLDPTVDLEQSQMGEDNHGSTAATKEQREEPCVAYKTEVAVVTSDSPGPSRISTPTAPSIQDQAADHEFQGSGNPFIEEIIRVMKVTETACPLGDTDSASASPPQESEEIQNRTSNISEAAPEGGPQDHNFTMSEPSNNFRSECGETGSQVGGQFSQTSSDTTEESIEADQFVMDLNDTFALSRVSRTSQNLDSSSSNDNGEIEDSTEQRLEGKTPTQGDGHDVVTQSPAPGPSDFVIADNGGQPTKTNGSELDRTNVPTDQFWIDVGSSDSDTSTDEKSSTPESPDLESVDEATLHQQIIAMRTLIRALEAGSERPAASSTTDELSESTSPRQSSRSSTLQSHQQRGPPPRLTKPAIPKPEKSTEPSPVLRVGGSRKTRRGRPQIPASRRTMASERVNKPSVED